MSNELAFHSLNFLGEGQGLCARYASECTKWRLCLSPFLRAEWMLYKVCQQLAAPEASAGTLEKSLWLKWQEVVLGDGDVSP